jgi:transcriptional regulator with XRE-family HTH domain
MTATMETNFNVYLAKNNLLLKEFAQKLGMAPSYIGEVCRGRRSPSKRLAKLVHEETCGEIDLLSNIQPRRARALVVNQHCDCCKCQEKKNSGNL